MELTIFLLSMVVSAYLLAFILFIIEFVNTERKHFRWANRFVELGFLVHTLLIFAQTVVIRNVSSDFHLPVTTLGEASGFFAWSLAFIYLILLRQRKSEIFGLVLAPILVLFLIPSFFRFEINPALLKHHHNGYFLIHILSAFFGYACFALSFIAGVLYLNLDRALKRKASFSSYHRFPSLEGLERFIFKTILWGIVLLGFAIISGALWTQNAFGTLILREPKSFASLLTWSVYLVLVYFHEIRERKGRRMVQMSLGAFVLVLFTFLGTSFFQKGLHAGVG
ncbi:MAG: cytochrome c biogenesis protein CcsA [Candidatus Omnitrophica bacterium]|nr:cytochrome c biogenesis protein CcsA [Candidatus Omnitrophota bacterium]